MGPNYLALSELMATDYPRQTWLAKELIPAGALTVMSASPGSYKTWLLLSTAIAVATGKPLFDHFKVQKGHVLIIDEETGEAQLKDRLTKLGAGKELPISFLSRKGFATSEENMSELLLDARAYDVKLVIIDTLVNIHSGDENNPGDMTEVFKQLRRLADVGIAVLVAHHNRKSGSRIGNSGEEMRGSSGILAAVDCHIGVSRKGKSRQVMLEQTKNRYGEELDPVQLELIGDTKNNEKLFFEYLGQVAPKQDKSEVLQKLVVQLLKEHERVSFNNLLELLKECGFRTNEHNVRKLLKGMVSGGEVLPDKGPPGNTTYYVLVAEN
jgi:predicted ATP-dependent serine protease